MFNVFDKKYGISDKRRFLLGQGHAVGKHCKKISLVVMGKPYQTHDHTHRPTITNVWQLPITERRIDKHGARLMMMKITSSPPKSFGKRASLLLTAENALVHCVCYLCNVHCIQLQLLSRGYATSIQLQSLHTSVPNRYLYPNPNPTYCTNPTTTAS